MMAKLRSLTSPRIDRPRIDRRRTRPSLEGLEGRNLLSTGSGWPALIGDGPVKPPADPPPGGIDPPPGG